ncbi:small integral membrane protein 4 [Osmia bicornis bicornis]|uniref:small integral membrane protein 4 n=1 Tax=Osmia bicornis bicornis TaxID=1437191 RepID=UPI0010F7BBC9|nr:small integral membrane protein 4 [Osmia bicornis bicornis]
MTNSILFNKKIRKLIMSMPGKALGEFRLLPVFFVMGALLEFTMIHWKVGEVNFYNTYKRRRVEEAVEERLQQMKMKFAENVE